MQDEFSLRLIFVEQEGDGFEKPTQSISSSIVGEDFSNFFPHLLDLEDYKYLTISFN